MLAEPLQFPAVLPGRLPAFGGFHLDQMILDCLIDRQSPLGYLWLVLGFDLAGEKGALCAPGFEGLSRSRPDGLLPAYPMALEFEVESTAFRADRLSIDENEVLVRVPPCIPGRPGRIAIFPLPCDTV